MNAEKCTNRATRQFRALFLLPLIFSITSSVYAQTELGVIPETDIDPEIRSYYAGAPYEVYVKPNGSGEHAWVKSFVYYKQNVAENPSVRNEMTLCDNWTSFDVNGAVNVRVVSLNEEIFLDTNFEVRPRSDHIEAQKVGDRTLEFTITKPGQYWVRIEEDHRIPLFIFANPPEVNAPNPDDPGVVLVEPGSDYIALFQQAKEIPVDEPSILYFKEGVHYVGSVQGAIRLQNATLYIPDGAVVLGTFDFDSSGKAPLTGLRLRGHGIIDRGNDENPWPEEPTGFPAPSPSTIKQTLLVAMAGSYNSIEGLTLLNTKGFLVRLLTPNSHFNNVKLFGYKSNCDGFNCSVRSLTENCFVKVMDDACKAYGANATIRNMVIWRQVSGGGVFIIRNMSHAGKRKIAKNLFIEDVDIIWSDKGGANGHGRGIITIDGANCDYGNFRFENWRINSKLDHFFAFEIGDQPVVGKVAFTMRRTMPEWPMVASGLADAEIPSLMENVLFKDIEFNGSCMAEDGFFAGPGSTIKNITFDNFVVNGKTFTSPNDFSPENGIPKFLLAGNNRNFAFIAEGKRYLYKNPMDGAKTVDTWGGPIPYGYGPDLLCVATETSTKGTPLTWLDTFNLSDDTEDPDLDGQSTWQEYICGTNPTNNQSVFTVDVNETTLAWNAVSNRTYSIEYAIGLTNEFLPYTNGITTSPLTPSLTNNTLFFRIKAGIND